MRNAEVRNVTIIEHVPFRGPLEGFFIVEDVILEQLNLLREPPILHSSVSFAVGNGREESIRNGAKELSIDVRIGGEGGLGCPWGHCWSSWSCQTRDQKGNQQFSGRDV